MARTIPIQWHPITKIVRGDRMAFDGPSFIRHTAERLVHEFRFSAGAGTPGLIGASKEHPARAQLEKLMPGGVGVGSGIVVDSFGGTSRQQDIVVFERLSPVFTHSDAPEATFYRIEGVIAVGEIKSGLGKAELSDAATKTASAKSLRRRTELIDGLVGPTVGFRRYGSSTEMAGTPDEKFDQERNSLDQLFGFVLCHKLNTTPPTILDNIADECRKHPVGLSIDLIVSLEDGFVMPHSSTTGAVARAMMDADGAVFSGDATAGFAQLAKMLRHYAVSGRTVARKQYDYYFKPAGGAATTVQISAYKKF